MYMTTCTCTCSHVHVSCVNNSIPATFFFSMGISSELLLIRPSCDNTSLSTNIISSFSVTVGSNDKGFTVEPPNKGHAGTSHFVICREIVLFLEVENAWESEHLGP